MQRFACVACAFCRLDFGQLTDTDASCTNGRNLVIPRAVMGYGFRARAQEHAQELLGELTREQAEISLRSQITADRETDLDRHLARHMDDTGALSNTAGLARQGTYPALLRGRIAHLEKLGLAVSDGKSFTLAPDFRRQLSVMAARSDVLLMFHERLTQGALTISPMQQGSVTGTIVRAGYHDRDLQISPFVIVRDQQGHEHYSRIGAQEVLPTLGATVMLTKAGRWTVKLMVDELLKRQTERHSQRKYDRAPSSKNDRH